MNVPNWWGILTLIGLAGCGSSASPDDVLRTAKLDLAAEQYDWALDGFDWVLLSDATRSKKYDAQRGAVLCEAYILGQDRARPRFQSLMDSYSDCFTLGELVAFGSNLAEAKSLGLAMDLVEWAEQEYLDEESKKSLQAITRVVEKYSPSDFHFRSGYILESK